ncbi:Cdc6/Cdc18 family protein [Halalkalicoccus ordinarius]|uniref:Cdc6/Cdc18 family protein n=1 Tax=Halalkalicoccus ordinarius TaxID=3116651 RepID=UPI00300EECCB
MITDARVFQDTFVPEEVVHRNTELTHLSGVLAPVLHGEPAETAAIFGPTGVGKTCCARYAVEQLRENSFNVRTQYVNCWQDYNRYRVLYRLLEGLDRTLDIHRQSTPRDVLYDRIREANDDPYVVVLDEVDQLEEKDVLYDLYTLSHISLILIANDEQEFYSNLGDRLYSRLTGSERVQFDPYSLDEIVAILDARANSGLANGVVSPAQMELIADRAAGDARVAIGILRTAARKAHRDGTGCLTTEIIEAAVPDTRSELRQKTIEQLSHDQQMLYEIIEEHGETTPGTLYEAYEQRCDDPKSRRSVRNYLGKMEHYHLIDAEGEKRARVYRLSESAFGAQNS